MRYAGVSVLIREVQLSLATLPIDQACQDYLSPILLILLCQDLFDAVGAADKSRLIDGVSFVAVETPGCL